MSSASSGQVRASLGFLVSLRSGDPAPQHPHVLGTPYSAVNDLVSLDFARVTEVPGMELEKVGTRRQPQR